LQELYSKTKRVLVAKLQGDKAIRRPTEYTGSTEDASEKKGEKGNNT